MAQDAEQHLTTAQLGNGLTQTKNFNPNTGWLENGKLSAVGTPDRVQEVYEYDALGNVTKRAQSWDTLGFVETFGYDDLNRLSNSQVANREATAQRFTYDATGNILSKANVANAAIYSYPATGSARPHAVKSIGSGLSFEYDDNGNLLSGASRSISWTSFDMPERISKGSVSANFEYGAEHQRIKQSRSDGSVVIYAGAQEVETQGGKVTVKTYWPLGIGLEIDKDGASPQLLWQHTDRLGSPIALTDQAGNVKEKLAYDAWGKRRNPDGSAINGSATPDSLDGVQDNRGYTGHEMLDQLDLVHMNGRIYEPLIARFLSADPILQDPLNGQSYNRYAYVLNNPTNLTDPTGFTGVCSEKLTGTSICFKTAERFNNAGATLGVKGVKATKKESQESGKEHAKNPGGNTATKVSANKPKEQSDIAKFIGDLKLGDTATQFGRRLMADFADNNRGKFGFWGWAAEKVDNNFERPNEDSAESVVAKVGAAAAMMTPGGARARVAAEAEVLAKGIGTIYTRTTRNVTRLGGEAGEPGIRIVYKDGTEFDMTATRVKQTEMNPYVPGSTRPVKFDDALNKQGTKRAPTESELRWFNSLSW